MYTHRVDVLDRADDDAVVVAVAYHLNLILLPAEQRLLNQHLTYGGEAQAARNDLYKLLLRVSDPTTATTEGEGGANNGG